VRIISGTALTTHTMTNATTA